MIKTMLFLLKFPSCYAAINSSPLKVSPRLVEEQKDDLYHTGLEVETVIYSIAITINNHKDKLLLKLISQRCFPMNCDINPD